MVRQHCPECGTEVPVDEDTGMCHVGHRVHAPATGAPEPSISSVPTGEAGAEAIDDEPAPWVATVDDDDAEPRREADPSAPPPPVTALGSATTPPPGAGSRPDTAQTSAGDAPEADEPVTGFAAASVEADDADTGPEPFVVAHGSDEDASLEELAAMAAGSASSEQDDSDDLSSLGDDLRGDLPATPEPESTDDFDLGSLEAAVAELGDDEPAAGSGAPPTPDLAPAPPGPDAAPDPATAVAEIPDDGAADEATQRSEDPAVPIRPDHAEPDDQAPAAAAQTPLDPTNFTAGGKRVSSPRSGGGDDGGLVGKLKGLFSR